MSDSVRTTFLLACCFIECGLPLLAQRGQGRRAAAVDVPQANPYTSSTDIEAGRKIYSGRCGHCHGQSGEGGRGAVLNSGQLHHAASDRKLFLVIRNGIPNTEMPGTFSLPEADVWRMVAYVKQLGRQGGSDVATGDVSAGALVYQKNGCRQCHSIDGQGGILGPDLSDIGAKRSVRYLRDSIVNPNADIPLDYRSVAVITADGKSSEGIHLNEDEYSIHLRDMSGNLRSFIKNELRDIKLSGQSLMPAYSALSKEDLANLVAYLSARRPAEAVIWTFDRLQNIGGHKTTVLGAPKIIDSPVGKAVQFDGLQDALFIDNHPLAGATTFTFEAIFRPDGGAREQRWFHLSEQDPRTGADTDNRMLFEIRVIGDQWFLDSFNQSGAESKALMNRNALHPLGAWYHVASVYDGKEFRNYVNGVQEGSAELHLAPHGPGHASIGVRINKVFYFKGAVYMARFTRRALSPGEFLTVGAR
jgi:putative heme-binding domain-containing protein